MSSEDSFAQIRALAEQGQRWYVQHERTIEAARAAVQGRVAQANRWVDANHETIEAVLRTLGELEAVSRDAQAKWDQSSLGYLVAPLGTGEHLVLALHAAPGNEQQLMAFLDAALADSELHNRLVDAIDGVAALGEIPRAHLKHGLAHVRDREALQAWPPLLIGLEGAFVDVAIERGLAARRGNDVFLVDANGLPRSQKVPSIEGVMQMLGIDAAASDFGLFLRQHVYGGSGNAFRHGTAQTGYRERVLCSTVAVIGWLDAFAAPGSLDLLYDAFVAELARRHEQAERGEVDEPPAP